jgi:hypothetical protein
VSDVAAVLAELESLDRKSLATRWNSTFGVPAPKSCQATLLRGALAWRVQMQALRESVGSREADRWAQEPRDAVNAPVATTLSPGTRLLREWEGRTHHVTVSADGFEYDGRLWRNLSAIARSITGTRWSGPLFFGLR